MQEVSARKRADRFEINQPLFADDTRHTGPVANSEEELCRW